MDRQDALYQLDGQIKENLPSLGAWQMLGLGLMVLGLVSEGWGHLSRIAEGIPEEGSYNTVRQRVKRWVSNPRLDVPAVCSEWIGWVCWWTRRS